MQKFKCEEDPSYCERETWEDWASRSSISLQDEASTDLKHVGKVTKVAGTPTYVEPPRSTAYYYGDLERLKRQNSAPEQNGDRIQNSGRPENGGRSQAGAKAELQLQLREFELSEYVEANDVINDGAIREVPPFRDRQFSLPEYSTPEGHKETYSTAGTFPMPEQKEKEPLLAELEIVGRVPLTQLDSGSAVRRSRSWYLCCPNVGDEEISRESSWRYSSLRPVTAPPSARNEMPATGSPAPDASPVCLRADRDALARALSLERQKAAAAARAHDARLAELHGVIAELVRRARGRDGRAIPEEDLTDECESTTQPAGELDPDTDRSRTEQNDTSSPSPDAAPHEEVAPRDAEVATDTSTQVDHSVNPAVLVAGASASEAEVETSNLSDKDERECSPASCRRDRGSSDGKLYTSPGGLSSRVAKLASRVRLKRTDDNSTVLSSDEALCCEVMSAQRVAAAVCAQADVRERIVAAGRDEATVEASASLCRARVEHLAAENRTLRHALQAASDTQHRLVQWCAAQESSCVCVCAALCAADRALETYDVLLALAETRHQPHSRERQAAERVAGALLRRLQASPAPAPLLSPGPWTDALGECTSAWSEQQEARLRAHAARLKADTVTLRHMAPPPAMYTRYDSEDKDGDSPVTNMAELEDAVALEELTLVREARAAARVTALLARTNIDTHTQSESTGRRRRKDRHKHVPNETQL